MKPDSEARLVWPRRRIALIVALLTMACAAAPQRPTVAPTPSMVAVAPSRSTPTDDSAVARPQHVFLQIRATGLNPLINALGQRMDATDMLRDAVDDALELRRRDGVLGRVMQAVDRDGPIDILFGAGPERGHRPIIAFAFRVASIASVERALAGSNELVDAGNGVFQIVGNHAPNDPMRCAIGSAPDASYRVVCSPTYEGHVTLTLPYFTRTLSRTPPPSAGIEIELDNAALRRVFGDDWAREIPAERARALNDIARLDPLMAPIARPMLPLVFDLVTSLLSDMRASRITLSLERGHLAVRAESELQGSQSSLAQWSTAALLGGRAVPTELLRRWVPGGYLYFAASADARPFQSLLNQIRDGLRDAIRRERGLSRADQNAANSALDVLSQTDEIVAVGSMGFDANGRFFSSGTIRSSSVSPMTWLRSFDQAMAALRRPALFRRYLRALATTMSLRTPPDLRQATVLPATGLPSGSRGYAIPDPLAARPGSVAAPATARRGARRAPAAPSTQLLFVPDGTDVHVIMGPDARALYQSLASNTSPAVDGAAVLRPERQLVAALSLPGLVNAVAQADQAAATIMRAIMQRLPDGGRTPVVARAGVSGTSASARLQFEIELPDSILRVIGYGMALAARAGSGP